ncbi:MAG: PspC domain-containing protein [Ignavibacteriales bacterium]|nr:PspC domain-containing protein [Ignavibacteriales bacterium]
MEPRRLYRSRTNKILGGVCGGMAEYFDVDPVIMRVLFLLLALFGGSGLFLYIASLVIIPRKPLPQSSVTPEQMEVKSGNVSMVFGILLVCVGGLVLLSNLGVFSFFHMFSVSWHYVLPVLLILLGMAIIYYKQSDTSPVSPLEQDDPAQPGNPSAPPPPRVFRRSSTDKKLFGVCGGMAQYFSIDATIIRILYVVLCLASFGVGIVLYVTLALVVPEDHTYKTQR